MTITSKLQQFKEQGSIDEKIVAEWIDWAMPGARDLVGGNAQLRIDATFADPSVLPLGRWMGCYPEFVDGAGKLTVLRDWSVFLLFLDLALDECCTDKEMANKALADRSRLKIGIMNDVYQPFAPLPEAYSMIRHHSLMLILSFEWLEADERQRWTAICRMAGSYIAGILSEVADPLGWLEAKERQAKQRMEQTATESCTDDGVLRILSDPQAVETVKVYLQLTCFGIAVLLDSLEHAVSTKEWTASELAKLPNAYYLEQDILNYIAKTRG